MICAAGCRDPLARGGDRRRLVAGRAARLRAGALPLLGGRSTTGGRPRRGSTRLPQFRTAIDGLGIHFLHVRSPHAGRAAARHHARLARLGRRVPQCHRSAHRPDRARRRRRRRLPRRLPLAARLRLQRQADAARLGRRADRRGLGGADGAARLRALRRAGRRLGRERHDAHRRSRTPSTSPASTSTCRSRRPTRRRSTT